MRTAELSWKPGIFIRVLLILGRAHFVAPSSAETAHRVFGNSALQLPRSLLRELLFDSVEDARGVVSRHNGTTWESWLPGWDEPKLNDMFMSWTTPAVAWKHGLPSHLRDELGKDVSTACQKYCRTLVGEGESVPCCNPRERCRQMDSRLREVVFAAQDKFSKIFHKYEATVDKAIRAQWPFAQVSLLPYIVAGARIVEDVVWFFGFVWSRHGANPTLQDCFEGEWGKVVLGENLKMMKLWRDAHRCNELLIWELLATHRFQDFRWAQMGHQIDQLKDCWQKLSNTLVAPQRALDYTSKRQREEGYDWLVSGTPSGDSLGAAEHGQYPGLILARNQFHEAWFLDKPTLRYLIRYVFTPGETLAEFGAFGGRYSEWLNDTGLVEAFAFDGIEKVADITGGRVQTLDLGKPAHLGRVYDWVLCLEVGEHMPKEAESTLLDNIARHAKKGVVMSWATPDYPSPYHPNTMPEQDSTRLIQSHGFKQDKSLTESLREAAETSWLKQTIAVYYKV